jgi:YhcH/YjgK/YiaL family protein
MILDKLERIDYYRSGNPYINIAFDFLKTSNLMALENGKHIIDAENVFALVMEYDTHPLLEGKWEAHRKYYDIQYILEGNEIIAISDISNMKVTELYNEEGDYELFDGPGSFHILRPNDFIVLKPHEVHQPGISIDNSTQRIKKIVVKALI